MSLLLPPTPPYRVIIAGSREFGDYALLCEKCDGLLCQKQGTHQIIIISGTARGADQMGERYARERGFQLRRFPADWEQYSKAAGFIRNRQMADVADALIAFWDGRSRGTANMIDLARQKSLPYRIVRF